MLFVIAFPVFFRHGEHDQVQAKHPNVHNGRNAVGGHINAQPVIAAAGQEV